MRTHFGRRSACDRRVIGPHGESGRWRVQAGTHCTRTVWERFRQLANEPQGQASRLAIHEQVIRSQVSAGGG
jgi:hypothetical protein